MKTPNDIPNENESVDTGWDEKYGCKPGVITWDALDALYYKKFPELIETEGFRGFIYTFIDKGNYIEMN